MYWAVLLDWDGTLADTRKVVVESFQQALGDIGLEVKAEFIERRIGTGAEQTFREILQNAKKPFGEAVISSLLANKIQKEISMSDKVRLFPGALDLLESLKEKTRIGLASMNNRPVINHLIKTLKIREFFDAVVTVEDVECFKPNPEIFLKCASKLQCKPEECLVIEDSFFGVQGAARARMDCIAVLTGVYSRIELETAKPRLIVESLAEKEEILNFIFR